jgi:hypothetical protein
MKDQLNAWREPTLEEILSDEIVRALMAADGVDQHEIQAMLTEVARKLGQGAPLRPSDKRMLAKAAQPSSARGQDEPST